MIKILTTLLLVALATSSLSTELTQMKSFEIGDWKGKSKTTVGDDIKDISEFFEHRELHENSNKLIITGRSKTKEGKESTYKWIINLEDNAFVYSNSDGITDFGEIQVLNPQDYRMTSGRNKCYFIATVYNTTATQYEKITKLYDATDTYICTTTLLLTKTENANQGMDLTR